MTRAIRCSGFCAVAMPGKTNTSRATTICKNFDMSGRESPKKSSRLDLAFHKLKFPSKRDAYAGDDRRRVQCSHIPNVRAMKLLLAIVNRPLLDLPVSALPLQRRLADKNVD